VGDRLRPLWDFDDLDVSGRRFEEQLQKETSGAARAEVLIRSWLVTFHPVSWRQDALAEAKRRIRLLRSIDGT